MSNKRSKTKYPGLNKKVNTKVRQELIDYDYLDKLSPEEKEWLNRFSEEFHGANFLKSKNGNYSTKNIHRTKKQRKDCYDRNNARNRDVYSITKSNDMLKDVSTKLDLFDQSYDVKNFYVVPEERKKEAMKAQAGPISYPKDASQIEDELIEIIDLKYNSDSDSDTE